MSSFDTAVGAMRGDRSVVAFKPINTFQCTKAKVSTLTNEALAVEFGVPAASVRAARDGRNANLSSAAALPEGTRLRLDCLLAPESSPDTQPPVGDWGTVTGAHSFPLVMVEWDCGQTFSVDFRTDSVSWRPHG